MLMNLDTSYNINPTTSVIYSFDVNLFKEYPDLHNQFHYLSVDHEKTISDERGILYLASSSIQKHKLYRPLLSILH